MKKIVAINCSPRATWNTAALVREAAKILIRSDTLQVKDYSRYHWTMFNPEHKQERHETVFPEDKKKAFALGSEMVTTPW